MASRNKKKMPPARPTNNQTVVSADINPAFRLQPIGDPAEAMLEEQYWRQTGVGGSAPFDSGGVEEEGTASESDVEERNSQEPLTYHIREYESPGRKKSRDVWVVKQPPSDGDGQYPAQVVPHLLLPTIGTEKGNFLEVPQWSTNRPSQVTGSAIDQDVVYHPAPTRHRTPSQMQNGREKHSSLPSTGSELVPRPALQNGSAVVSPSPSRGHTGHQPTRATSNLSRDHTTLHIRQYEGRDRKISFDIKVENHKSETKEDINPTEIPSNQNQFANGQSIDIVQQAYQGQTWVAGQGQGQGQGQGLNPTFLGQDIIERIYPEESYTERIYEYEIESSRTNYSLPDKQFSRNYNDYYTVDQPKGSKIDARSHQKAKRADRQSALNKAVNLIKNRRMAVLKENSSDDEPPTPVKQRVRRKMSPSKRGGNVTDSEVVLKPKFREKTLTSPEVESSPSPRVQKIQKPTHTVPNKQPTSLKRKPNTLKRPPMLPKRQAFMKKGPAPPKKVGCAYFYVVFNNTLKDVLLYV